MLKNTSLIFTMGLFCVLTLSSCKKDTTKEDLKNALTFYASFDQGINADFALGDKQLYTVPNRKARDSAQVGLHKPDIKLAENKGLFGNGLLFTERSKGYIYYPSKNNISYNTSDWSGAISFWLQLDPATDLEPGYCDPIQITDVSYNDASIWVDFTKENPRDFRLGVIGDRSVWNPNPEGPDNENPIFIKKLTGVKNPPFGKDQWTHILINFTNLNTKNGQASLYLNGALKGTRTNIDTPFTWDLELSNIYLGLGYIGLFDELSLFNRALTDQEISYFYSLENGGHALLK
ncbi:LamG-like jellyroll fold domain-containing protein [Aquimarina gracilis]|uniref:LamG-like jellyroll fold domain-containing protein n=1 Tax=Aquimarina gracilis TaxID=874422 RepID=A0ABU5ZWW8_9FLAO|nr:LamG-like jellyroll fold domain-containing protein [Aquimarina gracilis]MEB3346373.1 LamG-like jellyroll fold domain-containing protein [Aquimarina gracilis]